MNCQNCGQQIAASSKFCRYCGAAVEAPKPKRLCPTCGAELNEDALSCWRCETSFDTEQAAPNFNADFNAGAPRIHPAQGSRVDLGEYYEGAETAEGAPAPSADAAEGTTYAGYSATPVAPEPVPAAPAAAPEAAPVKKSKAPMIAAISTAAVVALGVGAFFGVRSLAGSKDSDSSTAQAAHAAEGGTTTAAPVEDSTPAETTAATEAQTEKKTRKTTTTTKAATTTTTTAAPAPEYEGRKYDPKAKKTVIVVDDPDTGAWSNCFGSDWIDYHTLPRNKDLHFTMEIKLHDTFVEMLEADILNGDEMIGFAPTSMTPEIGWYHECERSSYIKADFPLWDVLAAKKNYTDGTYMLKPVEDGSGDLYPEVYMASTGREAPLYMKSDGFIMWGRDEWTSWGTKTQTVEFTLTKDCINSILDEIAANVALGLYDEDGYNINDWGGLLFQCTGNFEVKKVTIDYGNILMNSDYEEWAKAHPGETWGE